MSGYIVIGYLVYLIATFKSTMYGIFILFPLKILNFIEGIFLWISGAGADKLLFNSSIEDGGISTDFFSSPSPLQQTFIIMFSISGGLTALFVLLSLSKATMAKKGIKSNMTTVGYHTMGSLMGVTIVPVITLTFLGLASVVVTVFTGGGALPPSFHDQELSRTFLNKNINDLENFSDHNMLAQSPNEIYAPKIIFEGDGEQDISVTLESSKYDSKEDYDNFHKFVIYPDFMKNDLLVKSLEGQVTLSRFSSLSSLNNYELFINSFKDIQSHVSESSDGDSYVNPTLAGDVVTLLDTIDGQFNNGDTSTFSRIDGNIDWSSSVRNNIDRLDTLSLDVPLVHDEDVSSELFELHNDLLISMYSLNEMVLSIDSFISRWENDISLAYLENSLFELYNTDLDEISNDLLQKLVVHFSMKNSSAYLEKLFTSRSGGISEEGEVVPPTTLSTIYDTINHLNVTLNGDSRYQLSTGENLSVYAIAEKLTQFESGGLTIALYQLASGQSDHNWRSKPSDIDMSRLLIGTIAVFFGVFLMVDLAFFTAKRVFDIAVLFLISPIFLTWSILDEGKKFRNWMDMMVAKTLSVVAIVLSWRAFDIVLRQFQIIMETSSDSETQGLSGVVMLAIIAIAGTKGISKSSHMISSLIGAGAGIDSLGNSSAGLGKFLRGAAMTGRFLGNTGVGRTAITLAKGADVGMGKGIALATGKVPGLNKATSKISSWQTTSFQSHLQRQGMIPGNAGSGAAVKAPSKAPAAKMAADIGKK